MAYVMYFSLKYLLCQLADFRLCLRVSVATLRYFFWLEEFIHALADH